MTWIEVGALAELQRRRKQVVNVGDTPVVVLWHDDAAYAFQNICIHQQRELVKGVILNNRLVCAGHQWAFELGTGWCRERERSQPVYETRVERDIVYVSSEPRPSAQGSSS